MRLAAPVTGVVAPTVLRDRVSALLDGGRRLTVVAAPAGYGKTVAVGQWAAAHSHEQVAWLALTADHNDGSRLASQLRRVLRVAGRDGRATLVLDDFHALHDPTAVDECTSFIEHAPEWLGVILLSRADPPSRLCRLRLVDGLTELGADDLAFRSDEVAELIAVTTGRQPSPTEVDDIMTRTEGWPMGLALDDDDRVRAYFAREVLGRLPARLRRFLLSTSVLDEMTGPLCDFVVDGSRSQVALEQLEAAGAFVTALDAHHTRFRCHPMFRAALRLQVRAEGGDLELTLLHRAADWHLGRGEVDAAVHYLVEAGAGDDVVEAAFSHGAAMFEQDRTQEVAEWIEQARPASDAGSANALLLEAAALQFGGEHRGVREKLDEVAAMPGTTPAQLLVADLLRAYAAIEEGATAEALGASRRVLDAVPEVADGALPDLLGLTCSRADVAAGALVAHGVASMYDGRLDAARRDLERVGEGAHSAWRTSALGGRALVEAWCGNFRAGEALATQALALADDLGFGPAARTTAWLALALVSRARDDVEGATRVLDEVEGSGGTRRRVVGTWVATERASLALTRAASYAGRAHLAGRFASQHPSMPTAVASRRLAVDVQVLIECGELDAADALLRGGFATDTAEVLSARVRLRVERGDTAGARGLLETWSREPESGAGRERQLWMAIVDHLDGMEVEAGETMAAVVAEAEAEGDVALFRAAGNAALGPARALYRQAPTAFLRAVVEQPLAVSTAKPAKGLAEQLTDREFMVLVHLPSRQSNAEIAEKLGVSLNTVKTHLKHIYRKLDVVGRSEAVDAAERLHLL